MRDRWAALLFGAILLALTTPAFGQNLLSNSDFDDAQGLGLWSTNVTGSWVLAADSAGCAQSNAAEGTSGVSGSSQYLAILSEECIPVDPGATPSLWVGATYRTTASVSARLYFQFFSDGNCASHLGWSGFVAEGPSATWRSLLGEITLAPSAGSLIVWIDFNPQTAGEPQYVAEFDRVYLGTSAELFRDAFESEGGSACRWSADAGLAP